MMKYAVTLVLCFLQVRSLLGKGPLRSQCQNVGNFNQIDVGMYIVSDAVLTTEDLQLFCMQVYNGSSN